MKLVGERRALASAVFAFYFLVYGMMVLSGAIPPEFGKAFAAIAGVYGLAFFSLVAGYFWARWYSVGVGLYGVLTSVVGMWQIGAEPVLIFIGGTHLAAVVMLWGQTMAQPYDGQTAWREKFHMDDHAVQRLGRSVIRAGVSLPLVLLYALMPKPGGAGALIASLTAVALTGLGIRALVKMKTWGVLALGGAGVLLLGLASIGMITHDGFVVSPALAGSLLLASTIPFAAPIARYVAVR